MMTNLFSNLLMKPVTIVKVDKKMILAMSRGRWPTLSTTFAITMDVMVEATEKIAKIKPVQLVDIPRSSRNGDKKGAAME
mmetsp:Transcript_29672/g.36806  ORF Transcript_29672/g.36806 Transcript_29672/m.36806 type:complete len:80 (+) Transcript_29672:1148-1387(+)